MKLKQNQTSTPQRTFEYSRVFQFSTGEVSYRRMAPDGYPLYIDPNDDPYAYLRRPNPPTPEAVAKAQFIDKTFVWEGSAANKAAKS